MPSFPAYHRQIEAARNVGLAMTRAQLETMVELLEAYAEDLATRVPARAFGRGGADQALRLAQEIIRRMALDLAGATNAGITTTADQVATIYAEATAELIRQQRPGLLLGIRPGIGVEAAAAVLSRPELSAAFVNIRRSSVAAVDRIIPSAILRGATSTQLGMELRLHVVGATALPPRLLLDRRRIGYAAIQALGYEPTPQNLKAVRKHAGDVAARAQLIARTEMMNAELEAHARSAQDSPVVGAVRWLLSSRHPVRDQCDALQDVDWYGLGPGVYPTDRVPRRPHPRDLCRQEDMIRDPAEWELPKPPTPDLALDPDDVGEGMGLSPSQRASLARALGQNPPASVGRAGPGSPGGTGGRRPPRHAGAAGGSRRISAAELERIVGAREDQIRARPIEWATVFDPSSGRVVLDKTSNRKDSVSFTPSEVALLKDMVFTHNHPRSSSFSLADVAFAIANDLAQMRVASRLYDYRLDRPPGGWPSRQDVVRRYRRIDADVFAWMRDRIRRGVVTLDDAAIEHNHVVWRRLLREFGLSSAYRRRTVP